jgi:hypothetical protein
LSRAGKKGSKKWSDSYNVKYLDSGEKSWIDFRNLQNIQNIPDEEEVLLVSNMHERALDAKLKELENWKNRGVYEEVKDVG